MYQAVEYAGAVRLVAVDVPAAFLGGTAIDAQFLALVALSFERYLIARHIGRQLCGRERIQPQRYIRDIVEMSVQIEIADARNVRKHIIAFVGSETHGRIIRHHGASTVRDIRRIPHLRRTLGPTRSPVEHAPFGTEERKRHAVAAAEDRFPLHADDTLSIRLPNSRLLDYADQTTVTVLLTKDKSAVEGMFVTMTDKHDNYCAGNTDSNGQVTVPGTSGKTNEDGNTTVGWEDEDGDRWTLTVTVEDYETGRPIEDAEVSIGKGGNITVTLPDGTDMDEDNRITVTVTDNERDPQEGVTVIVKGDLGQSERGETDEDGKLTVPAVTETEYHGAYIYGYTDGTFGPERSMSRSEAAAIFARLLSDRLDERIPSGNNVKFKDIDPDMWYAGYVEYLTGYGVAVGYNDRTYRGDKAITRAEFTAMAARFFDVYGDGAEEIMEQYEGFDDVSDGYWAAEYIKDAAIHGWVEGYGDGTFRADDPIDRAEVVTIVNRLLGREADEDYIADNHRRLVMFPDVSSRHWAYYNVLEAANAHTAILTAPETWDK